ncbi:hypothetical protein [Candidatus Walczuchella monophlebidarum]|uniref:hypothetical protein n=1 Tax=Candidatus Walczuchella monophlebidarum TaxID=1415657 RepID=UPI00130D8D8D|nr:hypothetical protein [Candidatus Walczuchella monophlebidarum]
MIGKTVICYDYRFTYEEVKKCISFSIGIFYKEITKLHRLAKRLRNERVKNGFINCK